jgi:4-carboxymuconolactone decarboxylase
MRKWVIAAAMMLACGVSGYLGMALWDVRAIAADAPDPKRAKGAETFEKVYGGVVATPRPSANEPPYVDLMMKNLFADIWSRDVMSIRDRRLVLMGVIAAQGEAGTFGTQMRAALSKGEITPAQANEIIVILTQYIGYPHTTQLLPEVAKAIEQTKSKP